MRTRGMGEPRRPSAASGGGLSPLRCSVLAPRRRPPEQEMPEARNAPVIETAQDVQDLRTHCLTGMIRRGMQAVWYGNLGILMRHAAAPPQRQSWESHSAT